MAEEYILKLDGKQTMINERLIFDMLKTLKYRKPKLYEIWINKIEDLTGKVFDEEQLNY